ncbi:hypothetical protein D3C80_2200210 [compost metagenome]
MIGGSGKDAPLALVGPGFEDIAQWLGLVVFVTVCVLFYRKVVNGSHEAAGVTRER